MSIKFTGRYIPTGKIRMRRNAVAPIFTALPSISFNNLYASSTFTAVDGTFVPNNAVVSRRWLLNGVEIGTGSTIIPNAIGNLSLEVTISTSGGFVTETTDSIAIVFEPLVFTTLPSITYPNLLVGSTFTAVDGVWTPANATMVRNWYLDNVLIGHDATVTPEGAGVLRLDIVISNGGGSLTRSSNISINYQAPVFNTNPSISPNGGPMDALFTGSDGEYQYGTVSSRMWLLNNEVIPGATTSTYTPDGMGPLVYRVTVTGPGGSVTRSSSPVTITAIPEKLNPPTWNMQTGNLGTFAEGTSISIPLLASDPENNIQKYEVISGALPNGTSLNLITGMISGELAEVVADTVYTFTIKVTDRTNLTLTGTFTINVANVKTTVLWGTDNTESLAEPAPGEPVSVTLEASSS